MTQTPRQMRDTVEKAPFPMTGRVEDYDGAALALARAMLIAADEDPQLLDVEGLDEFEAATNPKLWEGVKDRWPEIDDWLRGITGFQFGWAHSLVRFIHGLPEVGNAAIVEVGEEDDGG